MYRYRLDRVCVKKIEDRGATWSFRDSVFTGIEYKFLVVDANQRALNRWEYVIRVPKDSYAQIQVRPTSIPKDKALAKLERYSLMFMRATKSGYTGFRYCQLSLAVSDKNSTKDVVHTGEKDRLPRWLQILGWRIKQKSTVRNTRGTDAHSFIVLVRPSDYAMMIKLFFATKVWILKRGISLKA